MAQSGWRWRGVATVVGIVAAIGVAVGAQAQQPATLTMKVTENRLPGGAGQVTMTPLANNQVRVDIRVTGMPANSVSAAHIHTAQGAVCDNGAPITYPLTNVMADASGTGTSTTTITLTADKPVQANNAYVNVHTPGGSPGPGVICADVNASFTAGAAGGATPAAGQAPSALPSTGTGGLLSEQQSAGWMLAGLAAVVALIGSSGVLALARRRR